MSNRTMHVKGIQRFGLALIIGVNVNTTVLSAELQGIKNNDDLIKKWGCTSCHSLDRKIVGPSFLAIARSKALKDVNRIVKVIHEGSRNAWGIVPMPPIPYVPEADARSIAEWILALDAEPVASAANTASISNVTETSAHTKFSSLSEQSRPFVTISADTSRSFQAGVAWWLRADFQPFSKEVRGIPVKKIAIDWCYANEFSKELFPPAVYEERPSLDEILKEGRSFSLVKEFNVTNKQTALVGVYESCDGKAGTFLMLLKEDRYGKSKIAFLKKYGEAFFAYLIPVGKNRILFADCFECDAASVYTWTESMFGENIVLKGERVCLNRNSVIYSTADEHSRTLYETDKLEDVKVLSVGKSHDGYVWHQVILNSGKTGYVLNSTFNFEPGFCE